MNLEISLPVLTVFAQGLLSFFSPCVLPLVPLYLGYLAAGSKTVDADGNIRYRRGRVALNTLFFVLGISFAFFLLALGFTAVGRFFSAQKSLLTRIGGILVILFGLYQLGVFGHSGTLSRERRLPLRLDRLAMGPLAALLLGFVFSFGWTPCVGPALAGVLVMASTAQSAAMGFLLIGVYTLGFVLPFLAVGLFAGSLLDLLRRHQRVVQYTVKAGGVLLILMGVMIFTGWMNGITGYLSGLGSGWSGGSQSSSISQSVPGDSSQAQPDGDVQDSSSSQTQSDSTSDSSSTSSNLPDAPNFTLTDQFGNTHTLSDYEGKVVFLNFWATWCGPCQKEMPEIQALYEENGGNAEDLVVLAVANPRSDRYPNAVDVTQQEVEEYLSKNNYTYPVVMDLDGSVFASYGVSAFPTTFMITREGKVLGYFPGQMTREIMDDLVRQTQKASVG